jgi:hypothetical protein
MRKLMILLALLLTVGVTVGSTPAMAIIYPPCDTLCPGQSGSTRCSCPGDSLFPGQAQTCSSWEWNCYYP